MPVTKNLGKYLGVQLILEKAFSENLCRFLRESARSGWKAKLLNMAGRETLIQSTTFALPMYTMQTALLPQKVCVCDELDRMNRNFLWGSTDEKGKVHLVGWHHITKSRLRGGLGIRSARRCKIAMLGKLDWALNHGKERLWVILLMVNFLWLDLWLDRILFGRA